jgi:hypothetical protein
MDSKLGPEGLSEKLDFAVFQGSDVNWKSYFHPQSTGELSRPPDAEADKSLPLLLKCESLKILLSQLEKENEKIVCTFPCKGTINITSLDNKVKRSAITGFHVVVTNIADNFSRLYLVQVCK